MRDIESEPSSITSQSLLLRVLNRDSSAWTRLSKIYGPLVYHWSRRCGLSEDDSADIVQEAFGILTRKIDTFRREKKGDTFRGWLWIITRNLVRDHIRRSSDQAVATGGTTALLMLQDIADGSPEPREDADPRSATDHGLLFRTLELIRAEFEPKSWQAFWGMAVEQRTAAEVGAELGITKHAVHQAKYRVMKRLREEMEGLD